MANDLTLEQVRDLWLYEPETGLFRHSRQRGRARAGAIAGHFDGRYVNLMHLRKMYRGHRVAWLYVHGEWPNGQIDHIDGDGSNNRIVNLRVVSATINMQNQRRAQRGNTTGLLGVVPRRGRYSARIVVGGRTRQLGSYATAREAHEAYVGAKRLLHPGCTI